MTQAMLTFSEGVMEKLYHDFCALYSCVMTEISCGFVIDVRNHEKTGKKQDLWLRMKSYRAEKLTTLMDELQNALIMELDE